MQSEHNLSFTASEIDRRLKMAGEAVLFTDQTLTEEQKAQILKNLGISGGNARIGYVSLLASAWVEEEVNLYSQVVTIEDITENSQVDLTPDVQQLAIFYEKDLAFVTENDNGVVTVYAIGQKPQNDYTIQVTITEVT